MKIRIDVKRGEDEKHGKIESKEYSISEIRSIYGNEVANFFENKLRIGDKIIFASGTYPIESTYTRIE